MWYPLKRATVGLFGVLAVMTMAAVIFGRLTRILVKRVMDE